MSVETAEIRTGINPWETAELTAALRLRQDPSPETHERVIDEIVSDGAELIDAPMITRWQFNISDGKMVTKDSETLQAVWARGKNAKQLRAMRDSRFWLDYNRACHEETEQIIFDGEVLPSLAYNTQITFSPYPEDQEEAYGAHFIDKHTPYKRDRKYGLVRILYQTSPETAEVASISVENSHQLEAFYAVAQSLGYSLPEGLSPTDLLGEHIKTFVQSEERLTFERQLIAVFDKTLSDLLGGEFNQGRPKQASYEAYTFVMANQDILEVYTQEMAKVAADESLVNLPMLQAVRRIRRSYMAALFERYEGHDSNLPLVVRTLNGQSYEETYRQMQESAYRLGERGIRLKGACTILDPMEVLENMSEDEFKQTLNSKEEAYKFDKEMYCVVCQAPPKETEKKKMCGPCGICRRCDSKLKSKMRAA